jgi:hypothetical protein
MRIRRLLILGVALLALAACGGNPAGSSGTLLTPGRYTTSTCL